MSEYQWLGDPSIPGKDQRERLQFTHCDQQCDVKVDLEYNNVTSRCKCGVRVRMRIPKLAVVLKFLDSAGLPHDIGLFLRADRTLARV